MTNWQMFRVVNVEQRSSANSGSWSRIKLDKNVEYADGYKKHIDVNHWYSLRCGRDTNNYVEINIDETKCRSSGYVFQWGSSADRTLRSVPQDICKL